MKRSRRLISVLGMASVDLGEVECNSTDNLTDNLASEAPGEYDGFLIQKTDTTSNQVFVSGKVTASGEQGLALHVSSADGKTASDLQLTLESRQLVNLASSGVFTVTEALKEDSDHCFATPTVAGVTEFRLCYDGNEISIDHVRDATHEEILVLDRHVAENHPALETPRSYSVAELREMGKNKSFTSQIKFQDSVRSRLESEQAHLNLFPHINANDVLGTVSYQLSNAASLIGDLAPFLIPSNWVNADIAHSQSEADYDAWLLMKADSGNIAEGLAYSLLRDTAILSALTPYEQPLKEMRDVIHKKEILGLVQKGSTKAMQTILTSLTEAETQLQNVIAQDRRALALAVGLVNPDGITGVTESADQSIDNPPQTADLTTLQNVILSRSIELRQLDSVMQVAKGGLQNRWLSWVTPSGSLSLALPASIDEGKAQVVEVEKEREELVATLLQKIGNATDALGASVRTYKEATQNAADLKERLDQLHDLMVSGMPVSVTDLQVAIQEKMKGDTDLIAAKYSYFTAMGTLNRLLLDGPYLDVLTQVGANRDAPRP